MIIVILIFALIIGYVTLKGIAKGRSRMHHANMAVAMRAIESGGVGKLPSWSSKPSEIDVLRNGIVNTVRSRRVPEAYVRLALQEGSPLYGLVMDLAKNLEERGSLFVEQQLGAADLIENAWKRLPTNDKVKFVNMP